MKTSRFAGLLRSMTAAVVTLGLLTVAASSRANIVIDTFPDWDGNITSGWLATAQTITAPSNTLLNYRFEIAPRTSPGNLDFLVYEWGGSGPVGSALYSQTLPWDAGGVVDVTGINLALNTGTLYGMVVDLLGDAGQSVYFQYNQTSYSGGNGWWYDGDWVDFPGLNHRFRAEFGSGAAVPEPSTLTLLIAGLGAAGIGLRARPRRKAGN